MLAPRAVDAADVMETFAAWIKGHDITEVECLVPDVSGIPRGKILPANKFLQSFGDRGLRLPEAIFVQTISGDYPPDEDVTNPANADVYLRPDPETIRLVPWYAEPTAQVIADCVYADGTPVDISSREVLRRVLRLYDRQGWKAIVAPELEFFLVKTNTDPDYPLEPPIGRSGRPETARQSYGVDAVNEFDPLFEDVYDYCNRQDIDIDTLSHEAGAAQMEINFNHGDALSLADQVFLFKRTVRQTALRHNVYATFMAKPMQNEPGSSMHVHQSVHDKHSGANLFAAPDGSDTPLFLAHIAGLQKYLPAAMPLLAPNVNSYRRLLRHSDAPINVQWGRDNRTTGLRVPVSSVAARRVENRVAGADANPYLVIAATLAAGLAGIEDALPATAPLEGSAYEEHHTLPRTCVAARDDFVRDGVAVRLFGQRFVTAYASVKELEFESYLSEIGAWERRFLVAQA
jgi:glutamine synthetase